MELVKERSSKSEEKNNEQEPGGIIQVGSGAIWGNGNALKPPEPPRMALKGTLLMAVGITNNILNVSCIRSSL